MIKVLPPQTSRICLLIGGTEELCNSGQSWQSLAFKGQVSATVFRHNVLPVHIWHIIKLRLDNSASGVLLKSAFTLEILSADTDQFFLSEMDNPSR
jgi:hypothetical protein